jgi:hypothetical protein
MTESHSGMSEIIDRRNTKEMPTRLISLIFCVVTLPLPSAAQIVRSGRETPDAQTSARSIASIIYVDGVQYTTVADAYSALPSAIMPQVGGGTAYKYGIIMVPPKPSGYNIASTISIDSPFVRVVGTSVNQPTFFNCKVTRCFDFTPAVWPGPFPHNGGLENVYIQGNRSSHQVAINTLNNSYLVLHDVHIYGFNGPGAVGLALTNTNTADGNSEREDFQNVFLDNNTIDILMTGGAASGSSGNSFGHETWTNIQFEVGSGQTAISLTQNASLYDSFIQGVVNSEGGATSLTIFHLANAANVQPSTFLVFHADNTDGGAKISGVNAGAGQTFLPSGSFTGMNTNSCALATCLYNAFAAGYQTPAITAGMGFVVGTSNSGGGSNVFALCNLDSGGSAPCTFLKIDSAGTLDFVNNKFTANKLEIPDGARIIMPSTKGSTALNAYGLNATPSLNSKVPCTSSSEGMTQAVSDSRTDTWGATYSSGSPNYHVLLYCDGTNWTVAAK